MVEKYGKERTIGVDKTPLRNIAQNRKTIARVGSESVEIKKVGHEKKQLTGMLAILVSGKKLKPMVIKKGSTERCEKNLNLGDDFVGAWSQSGWMNGPLMIKFLKASVLPYTQRRPCPLSLDNYDAHWTEEV